MTPNPPKEFPLDEIVQGLTPLPAAQFPFSTEKYAHDAVTLLLHVQERVRKFGWILEITYSDGPPRPFDQTMLYPTDDNMAPDEWAYWQGKALIMIDALYNALNIRRSILIISLLATNPQPKGVRGVDNVLQGKGKHDK